MRSKAGRLFPRLAAGAAFYWLANAALLASEVRWHLLSCLAAFDLRASEAIPALVVSKFLGLSVSLALAHK
jgi:hypothetical protein